MRLTLTRFLILLALAAAPAMPAQADTPAEAAGNRRPGAETGRAGPEAGAPSCEPRPPDGHPDDAGTPVGPEGTGNVGPAPRAGGGSDDAADRCSQGNARQPGRAETRTGAKGHPADGPAARLKLLPVRGLNRRWRRRPKRNEAAAHPTIATRCSNPR